MGGRIMRVTSKLRAMMLSLILLLALGSAAVAQGTAISLGNGQDSNAPVEISADTLELNQENGNAVFSGGVEIVQGDMRLTAERVEGTYSDEAGDGSEIVAMRATGGVNFEGGGEVAESLEAIYDPEAGRLRMMGDVILTQGRNALAAETLDMDLETGNGVLSGRVRAVLRTGSGD
jgi:lipopolysaccharide export system protein LptA